MEVQISQKKKTDRKYKNFNMFYIEILLVKVECIRPIFLYFPAP